MSKIGEKNYLKNIGASGIKHAVEKPFSDPGCSKLLSQISAIMALMPSPPAKVLDLGCGTGWTSVFYAKMGYDVTGVDIAEDMVDCAIAKKHSEGMENLRFIASDYEHLNFRDEFDCAIFFDSLHHSEDESLAISKAYHSLKKGGVLIASEPGYGHSKNFSEVAKKFDVTEKDMPPYKLIKIGKQAGFRNIKVYPHAETINSRTYSKKPSILFTMAYFLCSFFYKRLNGIVLMEK